MFEFLFKQPAILARNLAAPQSESCEQFLVQCADRGYSHSMLRKIAWILLEVAPGINVDQGDVTLQDIELAVDHRARYRRSGQQDGFHWSCQ